LRRQARQRREYLERRAQEQRLKRQQERQERLRRALQENRPLPPELRQDALALQTALEFDTPGGDTLTSCHDDEYRWAGLEPPRVMVTTSREPSARLRQFAKVDIGVTGGIGDMRGYWGLGDVGDPGNIGNTEGHWGHRQRWGPGGRWGRGGSGDMQGHRGQGVTHCPYPQVGSILKHLFPVPRPDSHRVVTFANTDDVISFRNHTFRRKGRAVELTELGPRFEMRPYLIRLGTLEQGAAADVEWRWHPYTATAPKRRLLGDA
ncbi:IMP4 protein, partial [Nothocercus julius]|nr:IMP4 protein [Nothocercus julius]